MSNDATLRTARTLAAIAIAAALGTQAWADLTFGTFTWSQLPGFFTPLAAVSGILALLAGAAAGRRTPPWIDLLRVNATTYLAVTAVVYWVLLAGAISPKLPWANLILHGGAAVVLALDWILVGPRRRLPMRSWLSVLMLPLGWLAYLIVRALTDGWIPYPFLDPQQGLATVAVTVAVIVAIGLAVAAALHCLAAVRPRPTPPL